MQWLSIKKQGTELICVDPTKLSLEEILSEN